MRINFIYLLIFLFLNLTSINLYAANEYSIDAASNDSIFIINGEKFKAKTYCFGFEKNDNVIFIDGNPYGACVSAKIYNKRSGNTCELWCE